ncbi:DsbA family protein [Streptacidiphilus fuscans]|uniref:Thioredoxin domain-containing protein n=1 Tax=Streptacidiphilus fuscans TaxID=2789292 RepID=A0A931FE69_9ACTN|nr:thioredoxin domain-containing protein [Streptacidiphilus fuscans]MBF9071432.1 thioredoxin domain-containing protein [Streptacidiphilus fuscans]
MSGAIVVVFVIAGLIGSVVRSNKESQLQLPTAAAGPSGLAVPAYGHAPVTLNLYEDMRDPNSLKFENTYGATLRQLVASGQANIYYRETDGIDASQGGSGSLQAGNALGCAQDSAKPTNAFADYRAVLLNDQPAVSDDAFASTTHLIDLSKKVKDLDTDVFRACVTGGDHKVWVKDSTSLLKSSGLGSVPLLTMQIGGTAKDPAPETVLASATQSISTKDLIARVTAAAIAASPTASDMPSIPVTNGATPQASATPSATASTSTSAKAATDPKKKPTASGSPSASPSH